MLPSLQTLSYPKVLLIDCFWLSRIVQENRKDFESRRIAIPSFDTQPWYQSIRKDNAHEGYAYTWLIALYGQEYMLAPCMVGTLSLLRFGGEMPRRSPVIYSVLIN